MSEEENTCGGASPYYSTTTQDILYAHKTQKGIRFVLDGTITYETLSNDGWSSVKMLTKSKVNGKTKYYYCEGDMSGEGGTYKKITKAKYNKYLKQSWHLTLRVLALKKLDFIRIHPQIERS